MIGRIDQLIGAAVLALAAVAAPAQDAPGSIRNNPFERPGFVISLGAPATPAQAAPPVRLELRATMVGSDSAMANINGEILSVWQTYEGYRVIAIREGRVVLSKDGERLELNIYERQRGVTEGRDDNE